MSYINLRKSFPTYIPVRYSISICSYLLYEKIVSIWPQFFRPSTTFQEHGPAASIPWDQRSPPSYVRRARWFQVPGGAWIIGRSLRVRHGPAFAYDVSREGGRGQEGRERVYRQGSPDPLASGPAKARGLIYEWDQTTDVVDGADWPSPVPLWYLVRPIVGWFLLSRPVSFSCSPFLSLSSFFSSHGFQSRYRTTFPSSSLSFFNFFLFSRSLVLVAEDALTLVACVLLGTSRQLCADDCLGIIAGKLGGCCCRRDFFFSIKCIEPWKNNDSYLRITLFLL